MAYNHKSRLPDTPWHIGYTTKDENDPRRHKVRCIHLENRICTCRMSGCYLMHCVGSSHCKFYSETQGQWEDYLEEMKTEEDIAQDKAELYMMQKRRYVHSLLESGNYVRKYRFFLG